MPDEYYNMLPSHFYAKADGYLRKEYKQNSQLRQHCYISILPHIEKNKLSFTTFCNDIWPLDLDDEYIDEPEIIIPSKEKAYEIMHLHNPQRYPLKNGNGQNKK